MTTSASYWEKTPCWNSDNPAQGFDITSDASHPVPTRERGNENARDFFIDHILDIITEGIV